MVGLRELYETLEVHVSALLSLQFDSQTYIALLSSIIRKRLPQPIILTISKKLTEKECDLVELILAI